MPKKERKLTEAELKRKAGFEKLSADMEAEGFRRTDLTVGIVKANLLSFAVMLPFVIISALVFFYFNPVGGLDSTFTFLRYFVLLAGIIVLAVVHEGIHGLTWGAFAKNHFKAIRFGIVWKMLTPYCACAEPLKKHQYLLGSMMPTLVIGTGLTAIGTALGSWVVEALALIMIFGGGGDFIIIMKMLTYKSGGGETLFYDHPYECGVVAFERAK